MKLETAQHIAEWWLNYLGRSCEKIAIAGSIRREKSEVKDIEIVAVPYAVEIPNLFGGSGKFVYPIDKRLKGYPLTKNGPRYKQISLKEINIDLFLVLPPAQWGVIFTIRTGPASFSIRIVTHKKWGGLLPDYFKVDKGSLWSLEAGKKTLISVPTEKDFFQAIGLDWIEPRERK